VQLLAQVIEPFHGRILDPACGSGGMFVQSARFVVEHQKNHAAELSICGVEKTDKTGRLCRLNLAVHVLEGDIRHGGNVNSYYDDPHAATGQFDFVLANPPFNVNAIDKERLKDMVGAGRRFPFGLPKTANANYLWIQIFCSSLNAKGRAGFVMAKSASDARSSEQELRQKLIEARAVDVMVAAGPNMFYTVTLPCTLWFLDRGKAKTQRADTVLFIDARHIYRQVDRAHRDLTLAQIGFIANLVRLYRGEAPDLTVGGAQTALKLAEVFGKKPANADVPGLCKAATLKEIEAQGWSLNPGRYVGVAPGEELSDEDFKAQLETLNEELETSTPRRGRWMDNVFVERLWRSLKYEEIRLRDYANALEARVGIGRWIDFHNRERGHMAFGDRTPGALWAAGAPIAQPPMRRRARPACGHVDNARALPSCPQAQQQQQKAARSSKSRNRVGDKPTRHRPWSHGWGPPQLPVRHPANLAIGAKDEAHRARRR